MTRLLVALFLLLSACGGGGGGGGPSASGPITQLPEVLRTDLLFGYFAQSSATALETQPHTNAVWTTGDLLEQMALLTQTKVDGRKAVLQLSLCLTPITQGEAQARFWFQRLRDAGLLNNVAAVSWCDEPNTKRAGDWNDINARAMSGGVRNAMGAFPELQGKPLAVIYACKGAYPAISSFDWVSCDDYDSGCAVFSAYYARLPLLPSQRLFATIAGADHWRLDPACALSMIERDSRYVGMFVFVWQTVTDDGTTYRGIRENGMRPLYCQAGKTIVTPGVPAECAGA